MIATRFEILDLLKLDKIIGVEIGTDQGLYASQLLQAYPNLFLYTVDSWVPWTPGDDRQYAKDQYRANMRIVRDRSTHLELDSVKGADKLKLVHMDFIYIDAAHDETSVRKDLEAWWPLLKVHGLMAGHDFDHPGVSTPVIEFAKKHRLDLRIINEHGGPDAAGRPGSGMDRNGGWAHPTWYFLKDNT